MPHIAFSSAMAIGLAAAGADGRRWTRPTRTSLPPPPGTSVDTSFPPPTTYTKRSESRCEATVSSTTRSNAQSAFGSVMAKMTGTFCGIAGPYKWDGDEDAWKSNPYNIDSDQTDLEIRAIAKLVLDSKITCTAEGEYAYACASTWADAKSFAGASYEAFASAWADLNSGDNKCGCSNDIALSADAVTSGWGEIWSEIYAGLDDQACAGSGEKFKDFPTEVQQDQKIKCTGRVIVRAWAKAAAKIFIDGECSSETPTRCEACCVEPETGATTEDCTQDDCETDCYESVYQAGLVKAKAMVTSKEIKNEGTCTATINGQIIEDFKPDYYKFEGTVVREDGSASCEAEAYTDVIVSAASDAAKSVADLVVNFCEVSYIPAPIMDEANGFVETYVDIITGAYATCTAEGGDPELDGGCAFAKSFATGYAEACAQAIASAVVSNPDISKCDCDINVQALGDAAARETEIVFAELAVEVEARACNPDTDGGVATADIVRACKATTTADILAKSLASVVLEGSCVSGTKDDFCKGKCEYTYSTTDPEWKECLDTCEKNSKLEATTIVEAIAEITVTTEGYCDGEQFDTNNITGVQEVYVTLFETASGAVPPA